MRWSEIDRVPCPVAQAMVVIGDSWTVLILRDALRGATKFDEFQRATGASRAIISDRLSHLVEHGIMDRIQYEAHPPRYAYRLTPRGRALQPVLMTMSHWAETHVDKPLRRSGRRHTTCGHRFTPVVTCSECGEAVDAGSVTFDRARVDVAVADGALTPGVGVPSPPSNAMNQIISPSRCCHSGRAKREPE